MFHLVQLLNNNYCPQTKLAKVMFLHLSVSHSVHRGASASVHAGIHPRADTPPEQTIPSGNKWAVRILLKCILLELKLVVPSTDTDI